MKKLAFLLIIITGLSSFSLPSISKDQNQNTILGTWIWIQSVGAQNKNYTTTPKITKNNKTIVFTSEGTLITYKDNIEIRIGKYQITKGISVFDNLEHDLVSFDGGTYIIQQLDKQNLVITNNSNDGYTSFFKRKK